jgi:hypothetical protein
MAVALLAAVMMSLAGGLSQSIHHDAVGRGSNTSFLLASQQIEAIRNQVQANPNASSFTDSDGSTVSLTVNDPQLIDTHGNINFQAAASPGYEKVVTLNSSGAAGEGETYDVRWNVQHVQSGSATLLLLTVGVQPQNALDSNAVNLHALLP